MKRLRFTRQLLVSTNERKAYRATFGKSATVVKGNNDTGKSSLLKSLYWCLGAEPCGRSHRWKNAAVSGVLTFSVDDEHFRILRHPSGFAVFDSEDTLIKTFNRVGSELAPFLAELFDFGLNLTTRQGEEVQALPAYLFIPFYVDQDAGWTKAWSSFENLGQFTRWQQDVASFHMGIRPQEYYKAKAEVRRAQVGAKPLREERLVTQSVTDGIELRLAEVDFDVDLEVYESEIERLVQRCEAIRAVEQELKADLVDHHSRLEQVRMQIAVVDATHAELRGDRLWAQKALDRHVECPTCGAEYENDFASRFSIAVDEDNCRELLLELREEEKSVETSLARTKAQIAEKRSLANEVEALLQTRRGEVRLIDVVRREGRREVRNELSRRVDDLDQEIGRLDSEEDAARARMDAFTNRGRTRKIGDRYRELMGAFVRRLECENLYDESAWKAIVSKIQESGSDLPRGLLAYYYAVLRTIAEHTTSTFCPIVIDSPNQQDQDAGNYIRMLEFIRDLRPERSQLILGLVDDLGVDFGDKEIRLEGDRYSLLRASEYESASEELAPLIDAAMREAHS